MKLETVGPRPLRILPSDPPEIKKLKGNDISVRQLQGCVGEHTEEAILTEVFPHSLEETLNDGTWRERMLIDEGGRMVAFGSFQEFVEAKRYDGLGTTIPKLKRLLRAATKDVELRLCELIDKETQRPHGGDHCSEAYREESKVDIVNVALPDRPAGNSSACGLRRLRSQRPDLHSRVLEGELSVNAACIEAGFRKRMAQVPADARALAEWGLAKLTEEDRKFIVEFWGGNMEEGIKVRETSPKGANT